MSSNSITLGLFKFSEINECSKIASITVSRFEQHVADLAVNDNEGFRRQFEVSSWYARRNSAAPQVLQISLPITVELRAPSVQIGPTSVGAQLFIGLVLNWRVVSRRNS
jgi:hypothetical protein